MSTLTRIRRWLTSGHSSHNRGSSICVYLWSIRAIKHNQTEKQSFRFPCSGWTAACQSRCVNSTHPFGTANKKKRKFSNGWMNQRTHTSSSSWFHFESFSSHDADGSQLSTLLCSQIACAPLTQFEWAEPFVLNGFICAKSAVADATSASKMHVTLLGITINEYWILLTDWLTDRIRRRRDYIPISKVLHFYLSQIVFSVLYDFRVRLCVCLLDCLFDAFLLSVPLIICRSISAFDIKSGRTCRHRRHCRHCIPSNLQLHFLRDECRRFLWNCSRSPHTNSYNHSTYPY